MHLIKAMNTGYGVPVEYHELDSININYNLGVSHVNVAGYINSAAKENNGNPFVVNQIEISQTEFDSKLDIYNVLLNTELFSGAILVDET